MNQLKGYFEKHYPLLLFVIYTIQYWWSLIWYKESNVAILASLFILFVIAILIHVIITRILKGPNGVIVSLVTLFLFFQLQFVHYTLQDLGKLFSLQLRYPALIFILILGALFFHLSKSRNSYFLINKIASVFVLAFLTISGTTRIAEFAKLKDTSFKTPSENSISALEISKPDIDIYYLVFDSYTSSESLKKYHNFNNNNLKQVLLEKGFKFTENSRTKYTSTTFSLGSVFNMDTLKNYKDFIPYTNESNIVAGNLSVGKSTLFQLLENAGVDLYAYSIFPIETSNNKKIIWSLSWWSNVVELFQGTALKYPYRKVIKKESYIDDEIENYFDQNINTKHNTSVFYFYHFYAPHGGYMADHPLFEKPYQDRIEFANKRMLRVVNKIFELNNRPFIIVIQGDHGSREIEADNPEHPEKYLVFNAIYFPDQDYTHIDENFKPLNTFRVILNKYYGTNLPLLNY